MEYLLQIPQKAASYVSASKNAQGGGAFTPGDLLRATHAESSERKLAAGEGKYQQLAIDAGNRMKQEAN